jgi:hypothetical protein
MAVERVDEWLEIVQVAAGAAGATLGFIIIVLVIAVMYKSLYLVSGHNKESNS